MNTVKMLLITFCTLFSIGSFVVSCMAQDKPKPGNWKGEPRLSFKVTSEGKIIDLVYTVVPGMMGRSDCRVIIRNVPIDNNKVDYTPWKSEKGEAAIHIVGSFTSSTTFEGSGYSKWCTTGDSLEGVGMIGDVTKTLSAKHESIQ